jgi:4-amino-4-deoxy-L-arabinose transferase-like glycosyltransferase
MLQPQLQKPRPRDRPAALSLALSSLLLATGQLMLLAMAPYTRESRAFGGSDGVALLSSDSFFFLKSSQSLDAVLAEEWSRWLFLAIGLVGHRIGNASTFIVIANALGALVAGALLVDLGRRYSGLTAGVLSASVLLVNPMVSQWIRFVHTDSLFYSLVVAAVFLGERVLARPTPLARTALALIGLGATLLRPNGFLLLGVAAALVVLSTRWRSIQKLLVGVMVWVALVGVVMFASITGPSGEGRNFARHVFDGVVLEGSPEVTVRLQMPPAPANSDLRSLLNYALTHPAPVARLGMMRLWTETHQIRHHYPRPVNLAVGASMLLLLGASVAGFRSVRGEKNLTTAIAWVAIPLALLIPVTFAVAEGRYGWAYLITLAPLAGVGAASLLRRSDSASRPGSFSERVRARGSD